jgi:hypothetical protein
MRAQSSARERDQVIANSDFQICDELKGVKSDEQSNECQGIGRFSGYARSTDG